MTKKANVAGTLAALLSRIQSRLDKVGRETRQNTDAIATVTDQFRVKVGGLEGTVLDQKRLTFGRDEQLREKLNGLGQEVNAVKKVVEDREGRQTLRDQNNVQALVNLRDSTAKAFDQVKRDVETLLQQIQRLNERVGQADSKAGIALASAVTKAQQSGLPSDHVWLNKKLTGVYDTTDDLETRVKKLEKLIELYEGLRLAQVRLAEANGAFLAGVKA